QTWSLDISNLLLPLSPPAPELYTDSQSSNNNNNLDQIISFT
ncbi:15383_t:CDS:1, partial [Racocetra fulgida]